MYSLEFLEMGSYKTKKIKYVLNWIEQSVIRRHEMMIRRRLLRQRIHRRLHRYRGRRKSGGRRRKAVRGRQVRVEVAVSFDARQVGPRDTAINNVELIK